MTLQMSRLWKKASSVLLNQFSDAKVPEDENMKKKTQTEPKPGKTFSYYFICVKTYSIHILYTQIATTKTIKAHNQQEN